MYVCINFILDQASFTALHTAKPLKIRGLLKNIFIGILNNNKETFSNFLFRYYVDKYVLSILQCKFN